MIDLAKFGKRVRLAIKLNGYENVSAYAKKSKLPRSTIRDASNGKYVPSHKTIIILSDELGIPVDWLLRGNPRDRS